MLSLNTRPAALRSCKATNSRRSSSAPVCSRRPSLHAAQRRHQHRRLAAFDNQNTGMRPGGPQDVTAGSDLQSSDTNPSMDPAESPTYTKREEQSGLANANTNMSTAAGSSSSSDRLAGSSSSSGSGGEVMMSAEDGGGFAGSGRDLSDMLNESTGASSSSSSSTTTTTTGNNDDVILSDPESSRMSAEQSPPPNPRVHPVARTAGAAAASAAGTILGAAAGPVGAAAGAALGAAVGRRAADLLAGSDKQAEVYDAGAEPEQVAEDLAGAGDEFKQAANTVKSKASELVDRATEKLHSDTGGSPAAGSSSSSFRSDRDIGYDTGLGGQTSLSADLGSTDLIYDTQSGKMSESPRSSTSGSDHEHSRSKVSDAARSAADRVAGAAESLKESAVDAAQTAADKIQDLTSDLPLPEFPPSTTAAVADHDGDQDRDDHDDFHAAGGGVRLEDDQAVQAVRDRISGAADRIETAAAEARDKAHAAAAAASDRLSGVSDQAAAAADQATRTAADYGSAATAYGSPETSERVQDLMGKRSDQDQGTEFSKESGEAAPSAADDTDLTNAGWGTTSANKDWSAAETIVKTDVGTPTGGPGDISSLGAAAAAGGYGDAAADLDVDLIRSKAGGISGVESKDVGVYATRGLGDPAAGYNKGGRSAQGIDGIAEGRLAAGGDDAQAAVYAEPESLTAAGTSDSTADRVAEVYGVGADVSSGVEEAELYRKEAERKGE